MIEIKNLRNCKMEFAYDVRVDRASVLGNRFVMQSESARDKVCEQYKQWFYEKIDNNDQVVLNELRRLYLLYKKYGKLRLFCWCAPKRCHSETIKEFLEKYIN